MGEGSLSLQLPGARGNVHRVKVELGCQWASVHLQRPRPCHWEGPCPTRGMPLNFPSPRQTAQAIWFGGRILNCLKFSQEENIHHRSPVRRLDIRPGLPALPVSSHFLFTGLHGPVPTHQWWAGNHSISPSCLIENKTAFNIQKSQIPWAPYLCHVPPVQPEASDLTSLCLNFLDCKMEIRIASAL